MSDVPREHRRQVNGVELVWFEWGRADAIRPTILLVHATGFHARCWDRVVARLPGRHVIAVDLRGHGRSGKTPPFSWDTFGADVAALVEALGLRDAIGVGHSMGGYSVAEAAALVPGAFSRLLLVDPVIMAPDVYAARGQWIDGEAHPTAKRRNAWTDWQEMFARFEGRLPFSAWDRDVLEDYCRYGVLPDEHGEGFVLACPPRIEASIYVGSAGRDIYALIDRVRIPVTVLRAKPRTGERDVMDFSASPTWPELASRFPEGRDVLLDDHSHFIPMEDPALTAEYILGTR
ncbi:MAG: alpha/beta hydrolase [Pseudomonadales bacterium]|jgi:pimeloyl-ACP methyl ester carboxylesterase|nr:alpha/beta hydrolase [Pseudomonadales bacterium]